MSPPGPFPQARVLCVSSGYAQIRERVVRKLPCVARFPPNVSAGRYLLTCGHRGRLVCCRCPRHRGSRWRTSCGDHDLLPLKTGILSIFTAEATIANGKTHLGRDQSAGCRSTATAANSAAKPPDSACHGWTSVECRPSVRPATDGAGQLAYFYGSEGCSSPWCGTVPGRPAGKVGPA